MLGSSPGRMNEIAWISYFDSHVAVIWIIFQGSMLGN